MLLYLFQMLGNDITSTNSNNPDPCPPRKQKIENFNPFSVSLPQVAPLQNTHTNDPLFLCVLKMFNFRQFFS